MGLIFANIPTMSPQNQTLTETNDGVSTIQFLGGGNVIPATVFIADILTSAGVIHVIDQVLLPTPSK